MVAILDSTQQIASVSDRKPLRVIKPESSVTSFSLICSLCAGVLSLMGFKCYRRVRCIIHRPVRRPGEEKASILEKTV